MKLLIPLLSLLLICGVSVPAEPDSSDTTHVKTQAKTNSQNKNKIEKPANSTPATKKEKLNKLLILNMLLKQKNSSGN